MAAKLATVLSLIVVVLASPQVNGQDTKTDQLQSIPLTVPAGVPLRLYLTKRVFKRTNAPVEARLLTPLYAFDREVIPPGTPVVGHVSRVEPVPKWERIRAVLGGDFTPLRVAQIEFTSLLLPDGRTMELHTIENPGLKSLVPLKPPKQRGQHGPVNNAGILSAAKQNARDQIDAQIARVKSIPDLVRGTDKKEWLYDYAMSRLPYHPQSVRNRTRFDAELREPLNFGSEIVTQDSLALLGSQPAPGSTVHARLLTPLDSMSSTQGDKVEAVLEQPLFSNDHKLILPEGTLVEGSVAMTKRAGWFHRPGRLRFNFQEVNLPPQVAQLKFAPGGGSSQEQVLPRVPELQFRTQATLSAAEGGKAPLKVDKEGGVQATESKTRFVGLAAAVLIARAAGDNERERGPGGAITGQSSNVGGRTLGGGLGFGLLGSIAAQCSPNVGMALGYYGLAWSVYSTVIARGAEVQFDKNAVIDIGFNQREPAKTAPLQTDHPASAK
ncbi:MAG: hypothetical protein JWO80_1868 [Bryobacterales bacterium]|nr:hypothetical protein [Bryobacterales bacterium]